MDVATDLPVLGDHLGFHRRGRVTRTSASRSSKHIVRAAAKRHAQLADPVNTPLPFGLGRLTDFPNVRRSYKDPYSGGRLRPNLERAIRSGIYSEHTLLTSPVRRLDGTTYWEEAEEGRDLARSNVPLPSDRARRCPSLERQDAFCDADTFKGNVRTRRAGPTGDEDAQVAELYGMGLLYDDVDDAARNQFDLNSIPHEEPVYSIRPAKRARRSHAKGKTKGDDEGPLNLDLSFADLGSDEAIARYLSDESAHSAHDVGTGEVQHLSRRTPMRAIYGLVGSRASYDVDTSQPPDLIDDDILSDYDCFSDAELDDGPAEREVEDGRTQDADRRGASEPWVMLG